MWKQGAGSLPEMIEFCKDENNAMAIEDFYTAMKKENQPKSMQDESDNT